MSERPVIRALIGNPLLEAIEVLSSEGDELGWTSYFRATWDEVHRAVEILGVGDECGEAVRTLQEGMKARPWPLSMGDGASISLHQVRAAAADRYAWAVPGDAALDALVKLSPLVEIGAGTGYWAALLASRGADVVAYDINLPGEDNHWHEGGALYFPVQVGGPEMAAKHPDRTLFLCWPPYRPTTDMRMTPPEDPENWNYRSWDISGHRIETWKKPNFEPDVAYEALRFYEYAGGQRVAYIGEGSGGCTAGPSFFARLGAGCDHWGDDDPCTCAPAGWEETDSIAIPQWEGIHDYLSIYRRKLLELGAGS